MSRVSHFQRFSQQENHATNNTLLLLRYFYQSSPSKMQNVMNSLLGTELSIGLTFEQQVRIKGGTGVPDALIKQEPMRIYVETKRGGDLDIEQIRRHIETIVDIEVGTSRSGGIFLIGLTKEPIADRDRKQLAALAASKGITFAAVTFSQIIEELRANCAVFEQELRSIVDDYEAYLNDERLLEGRNRWLPIFPCGVSIAENERFGLYYQSPARPCLHNFRFIGAYDQKAVALVGEVEAITVVSWADGKPSFSTEAGKLTEGHRARIRLAVEQTSYYNLKDPNRFYLVDSFLRTNAKKTSSGGIWGMRYLDLARIIPDYNQRKNYSTAEMAEMLARATWE